MELRKCGYSAAMCAVAVVAAACRSVHKNKKTSVIKPFLKGPEMLVTCMEESPTHYGYVKREKDGILVRADAMENDTPGIDLSFGEGIPQELPPELISSLLSVIARESCKTPVSVRLSAEGTPDFSQLDFPQVESEKRTVAIVLGETDDQTLEVIKNNYGEENVKSAKKGIVPIVELLRSAAANVLFAGSLREVADFIGVPIAETSHLLGLFQNGTDGFILASSPELLDAVRNQETLFALQKLSEQQIKAGILITQR